MKTQQRIYLYLSDFEKLMKCSKSCASRYVGYLKTIVGKTKQQRLTVFDFCKAEQVNLTDIKAILNL